MFSGKVKLPMSIKPVPELVAIVIASVIEYQLGFWIESTVKENYVSIGIVVCVKNDIVIVLVVDEATH